MLEKTILAASLAALLALPISAQAASEKEICVQELKDVQAMRGSSAAGAKANKAADDMLEVAQHLCEQGNFAYAKKTFAVIRGILTNE